MDSSADAAPLARPKSPSDLFIAFTLLALQGFGGVLAIAQRELVERRRWMSNEDFVEEWAVAQIMPGPNIINLSIILGSRYFGVRGALAALAGMVTIPLLVLLCIALVYAQFSSHPGVAGALRGMGAVAAGLIIAVGLKLFPALGNNTLGLPACTVLGALSFAGIALLRWPLALVLLGLGGVACVLAYRRLAP
ncbi:MAG: chromate transporter [Curvibacter sp.]|jgi:chromate transporter|nr:chromate transporter [Curvibacter sp.]